jgi:hypothetical protein
VAIEIPEVCNFTRTAWAWISREERKALRRALEAARKKREKSHDVDRSDLAAVSEGTVNGESLDDESRAIAQTNGGGGELTEFRAFSPDARLHAFALMTCEASQKS